MFNVYPVEISYVRTAREGILAGIPRNCTLGVADEAAGRQAFADLIATNPDSVFSDLVITKKK